MAAEYDIVGGYIPSFVEHLKETSARLGLGVGSEANEEGEGVQDSDDRANLELSPWTPAEYDAFFRALSVHSRWRPDLIAACVPTRSEWEVWMYLEALEEGALALEWGEDDVGVERDIGDGGADVEMVSSESRSQSGSGSDSGTTEDAETCEPAYEVSQAWIDAEEVMASWITREESLALAGHPASATVDDETQVEGENQNEIQEPPKRKRGRPRASEKGRPRGRSRVRKSREEGSSSPSPSPSAGPSDHRSPIPDDLSQSNAHQHPRDPSALPARKRRKIERKRDALMTRLDSSQLLVLESILREGEGAMKEGSKSREGSVADTGVFSTQQSEPGIHGAITPGESDGRTVQREASNASSQAGETSNAMIDPVLLALSGDASEGTSTRSDPDHDPVPGPSKLPSAVTTASQTTAINTFTFPPQNILSSNPEPPANVDSDLSLLSPRARRRLQKRLYMRRRRALLRENSLASEGVLDTGIEKLKPGRKAKSERGETPGISMSVPGSEAPSDEEMDTEKNEVAQNKPGLTLPYKLKAQFSRLGVDSAYLRARGIDLLNLGALGRLMGLFTALEQRKQGEEGGDETAIAEYIDAQLIQQLQTALISFVTDVLHRAIVWKEGEKKLKQRSRAWRYGDQITIASVEHAVRSIGSRYQSHKQYFKSAVAFYGLSNENDAAPEELTLANASVDADAGPCDGLTDPPLPLSLHRDIYAPHICPPSALQISALKHLSQTYEQEATRTRRGSSADIEDDLMPDETDEEALEAELEEDDEVDSLDLQTSSEYEQGLWDAVRRT